MLALQALASPARPQLNDATDPAAPPPLRAARLANVDGRSSVTVLRRGTIRTSLGLHGPC